MQILHDQDQGLLSLDDLPAPLLPLLHAPLVDLCLAEAQALEKLKALHCTAAKPKTLVSLNKLKLKG